MPIPRPYHSKRHPERFDCCQLAIEDKLIELVGRATHVGWHRDEILSAITDIADNLFWRDATISRSRYKRSCRN